MRPPSHCDGLARFPKPRDHQMPVAAQLTANGYSPDEAAEIVLLARKSASPGQWTEVVLAAAAVERLRYRQALALAFPASQPPSLSLESASESAS
jgi:hypothetical protein